MKNASQTTFRYKWLLLFGILTIIIMLAISSVIRANSWILLTPAPTLDPFAPYDPATYGLPDTIAGYKVLAVQTPENTACMKSGTILLILQTSDPNLDSFLKNSRPDAIKQELNKIAKFATSKWEIGVVGPGLWDPEKFAFDNEKRNLQLKTDGCAILGPEGAVISSTVVP